ncbi:MAG: hypothetical protein RIS64_3544 [Bacteroidota bacterium]|jgi:hypothetical protein
MDYQSIFPRRQVKMLEYEKGYFPADFANFRRFGF